MFFKKKKKNENSLFKGVMTAYFIVVLHVLLIAGVGLLVIFFQGIINYMPWILLGGSALIIATVYLFYRRIKKQGMTLRETLNSPMFQGRTVEVSLLGGLASVKVGDRSNGAPALGNNSSTQYLQIEDTASVRLKELAQLANLLEKNLITLDEYNAFKQQILKTSGNTDLKLVKSI
ncbi:MAG: SHOCT domain-containing protein [Deltaproteobacteria bacterium]|nr:SHOCT domain-containing protein [Deltaproteobacteria bacterium]MBW1834877.1 SHOCT domain-containing protein [Deltaproteobacteria bacterium]MBW2166721.1 SHOCT domain-containing protein [Deltaproteobacteria bacterium]